MAFSNSQICKCLRRRILHELGEHFGLIIEFCVCESFGDVFWFDERSADIGWGLRNEMLFIVFGGDAIVVCFKGGRRRSFVLVEVLILVLLHLLFEGIGFEFLFWEGGLVFG